MALSASGSTPRTSAGRKFVPAASMPSIVTYGATPTTPGTPSRRARHACQSSIPDRDAIVACAFTLKSRVRVSVSRPFITDRMTISAATPSAIPASDATLMNDTTPRRLRERRYRRPTNHSSG